MLMDEESRDKTTFVTRVWPFDLTGAPATFQRSMDLVMNELNLESCLVYLDDIIVFSVDIPIKTAGLKLKPSKCALLQRRVGFLGHIVSEAGVETNPTKIDAVTSWPIPKSVRNVRSFLRLCSYYRIFVPDFAEIAAPLHALAGKYAKFTWTKKCQHAFDQLKTALSTSLILAMPTDGDVYILDTDTSEQSIGSVLLQVQQQDERVIAYASRTYNKAERNYCTNRKELLAVVYFMSQFKQYLLGAHFLVRTDHSALTLLQRATELVGQQARWQEHLQEFNFYIQHRPGHKHLNADALSRRSCVHAECCSPKERNRAAESEDELHANEGGCGRVTVRCRTKERQDTGTRDNAAIRVEQPVWEEEVLMKQGQISAMVVYRSTR